MFNLDLKYHPDRNNSKESQERFVKISNAYSVLSKPDARRNYDLGLPRFHHYQPGTGFNYHKVPTAKKYVYDKTIDNNKKKQLFVHLVHGMILFSM